MGEFGAISVISGNIIGRTQTLTLYVEGAYKVTTSDPDLADSVQPPSCPYPRRTGLAMLAAFIGA